MNNDNNDDRDDDATSAVPHSYSSDSTLRREPGFSVFDSDTELEVDDIEPEDFANDDTELDEPLATASARTPWDDDNAAIDSTSEPAEVEKEVEEKVERDDSPVQDAFIAGAAAPAFAVKEREPAKTGLDEMPLADYGEDNGEDKDEYQDSWDHHANDDDGSDDYEDNEYVEERAKLPAGLIIVALVAIALLAAGGYGVIKERTAAEAELTELRARLATAVEQEEIESERQRARNLETENANLLAQLDALSGDNGALTSELAAVQQQLQQLQEKSAQVASKPAPKPAPVAASARAADTTAQTPRVAAVSSGSWFVNFGSYSQRAMAEEWASRLRPDTGKVTVAATSRTEGTIYRVRVIDLDTKAAAQRIAAELEQTHDVSKLWVGQQ